MAFPYKSFCEDVQEAYTAEQVATMQQFNYTIDVIQFNARKKLGRPRMHPVGTQTVYNTYRGPANTGPGAASFQPCININNNYGHNPVVYNNNIHPGPGGQQPYHPPCLGPYYGQPFHQQPLTPVLAPHTQSPAVFGQQTFTGYVGMNLQPPIPQIDQPGVRNRFGQDLQPTAQADNMVMSTSNGSVNEEAFRIPLPELALNSDWNDGELNYNSFEIDPPVMPASFTFDSLKNETPEEEFLRVFGQFR